MKTKKTKPKTCQECGAKTNKLYPGWIRGLEKKPREVCKTCRDKMDEECAAGLSALFG